MFWGPLDSRHMDLNEAPFCFCAIEFSSVGNESRSQESSVEEEYTMLASGFLVSLQSALSLLVKSVSSASLLWPGIV